MTTQNTKMELAKGHWLRFLYSLLLFSAVAAIIETIATPDYLFGNYWVIFFIMGVVAIAATLVSRLSTNDSIRVVSSMTAGIGWLNYLFGVGVVKAISGVFGGLRETGGTLKAASSSGGLSGGSTPGVVDLYPVSQFFSNISIALLLFSSALALLGLFTLFKNRAYSNGLSMKLYSVTIVFGWITATLLAIEYLFGLEGFTNVTLKLLAISLTATIVMGISSVVSYIASDKEEPLEEETLEEIEVVVPTPPVPPKRHTTRTEKPSITIATKEEYSIIEEEDHTGREKDLNSFLSILDSIE